MGHISDVLDGLKEGMELGRIEILCLTAVEFQSSRGSTGLTDFDHRGFYRRVNGRLLKD